jgi:hypothetical protein
MYIDKTVRSYYKGTEQRTSRARFLILVSLGMTEELVPCKQCAGFKQFVFTDDLDDNLNGAEIVRCSRCNRIPCDACERKGWTYDETRDEHAQQCTKCNGRGDLGASGFETKYTHQKEIRALVRRVAMHQCGHWMMGSAEAFGHKLSLSGSYGGDGLTVTVPRDVFEKAVPIPQELHEAWNKGGGWNSAGSEAGAMREWALANLSKLEPARKRKR